MAERSEIELVEGKHEEKELGHDNGEGQIEVEESGLLDFGGERGRSECKSGDSEKQERERERERQRYLCSSSSRSGTLASNGVSEPSGVSEDLGMVGEHIVVREREGGTEDE